MRILLLDNIDSFTFNLYHYLVSEGMIVDVFRNYEISVDKALSYDAIVLSPGPGLPKDAGIMPQLLEKLPIEKPVLGVCLGLQAIVERFGGTLQNLPEVLHGRSSNIFPTAPHRELFDELEFPLQVGHYHSWAAKDPGKELIVTSESEKGWIMSVKHKLRPIHAVQFHPESVLTPNGNKMIQNWINSLNRI